MSVDNQALLALSAEEKLRIIEMLWDNLGESSEPIPLPDWVNQEARRRLEEMRSDPAASLSHEEVWKRIDLQFSNLNPEEYAADVAATQEALEDLEAGVKPIPFEQFASDFRERNRMRFDR
jgi:putative addiction module component (TIGR02574 family)